MVTVAGWVDPEHEAEGSSDDNKGLHISTRQREFIHLRETGKNRGRSCVRPDRTRQRKHVRQVGNMIFIDW
jgi:hypothetical protein